MPTNHDSGVELHVPGVATLKNIREKHFQLVCNFAIAVAMVLGAYFLWHHDTQAATERHVIAEKIEKGNHAVQTALKKQIEQQRLQTCMYFLTLSLEQQTKIKLTNPKICDATN